MSTSTVCSAMKGWFHIRETLRSRKPSNKIGLGKKKRPLAHHPTLYFTSVAEIASYPTQCKKFALQIKFIYSSIALQPIRFNKIHVIAKLTYCVLIIVVKSVSNGALIKGENDLKSKMY